MRAGRLWLAALLAVAGLAVLITLTAEKSADGAPRGSVLTTSLVPGPAPDLQQQLGACSLPGGETGGSSLRLDGPCPGVLNGHFACVNDGELEALSTGRAVGGGKELYLTILLFDFAGPGDYFEDEISAQVIGPATVPRWTSLGTDVDIQLEPSGDYVIGDAVLLPELGTPAQGVITLHGRIVCG